MNEVFCPYCHKKAMMVTGATMYPHRSDLHSKYFYLCRPCQAHVGCHPGTTVPLGILANQALRRARSAAHAAFDPMWKGKSMKRKEVYQWLADGLGINVADCHIGAFDLQMCQKVVTLCKEKP